MHDLAQNPVIFATIMGAMMALVSWCTSLFQGRRQKADLANLQQQQALDTAQHAYEMAKIKQQQESQEALHTAALTTMRLEGEMAEARRVEATRLEAERLRLDTVSAQKVLADALEKTTRAQQEAQQKNADEQRQSLLLQTDALAKMAIVQDQTHAAVNSAKTAMEVVLQDLRNQLRTSETALSNAVLNAAKDIALKDQVIATLTQQLAVVSTPHPVLEGAMSPAATLTVTIPTQTVPVEGVVPNG